MDLPAELPGERPVDIIETLNLLRLLASGRRRVSMNVAWSRHQADQGISSGEPGGIGRTGGETSGKKSDTAGAPAGKDRGLPSCDCARNQRERGKARNGPAEPENRRMANDLVALVERRRQRPPGASLQTAPRAGLQRLSDQRPRSGPKGRRLQHVPARTQGLTTAGVANSARSSYARCRAGVSEEEEGMRSNAYCTRAFERAFSLKQATRR